MIIGRLHDSLSHDTPAGLIPGTTGSLFYLDTSSKGGMAKACIPCLLECLELNYIFGNERINESLVVFRKIVHAESPVTAEPVLELVHCRRVHVVIMRSILTLLYN